MKTKMLTYLSLLLLVISCAKNKNEAPIENEKAVEIDQIETVLESTATSEDVRETFEYQQLTTQKLQDYFDLLVLQRQHPEFKEDITTQLKELSKDSIKISETVQQITITNVQQIGAVKHLSDSLQKIVMRFDMISGNAVKSDSITALISTKKIHLDNREVTATKVLFSKEKPTTANPN